MMSKRNYKDFCIAFRDNDRVDAQGAHLGAIHAGTDSPL